MMLGIILVVFLLLQITPGDPVRQIVGLRATEEQLDEVREEMGLNDSILVQYGRYVALVAQGDLGYSYKSKQPVTSLIGDRIVVTAWLLTAGIFLMLLISLIPQVSILSIKPFKAILCLLNLLGQPPKAREEHAFLINSSSIFSTRIWSARAISSSRHC